MNLGNPGNQYMTRGIVLDVVFVASSQVSESLYCLQIGFQRLKLVKVLSHPGLDPIFENMPSL